MRFSEASYEEVAGVALALCAGSVVLGEGGRAVGLRTEAVPGAWSWSVTGLQGQTLVLAHDPFEAARWFCLLEAGLAAPDGIVILSTDAHLAALERYENWGYTYRFDSIGDRGFVPPFPAE